MKDFVCSRDGLRFLMGRIHLNWIHAIKKEEKPDRQIIENNGYLIGKEGRGGGREEIRQVL